MRGEFLNFPQFPESRNPEIPKSRNLQTLPKDRLHNLPVHIRQSEVAALKLEDQFFVVDPEATQDRGVEIVDMDRVAHDVIAEVVRRRSQARFDPAASQPDGKAAWMMVAPVPRVLMSPWT